MAKVKEVLRCSRTLNITNKHFDFSKLTPQFLTKLYFLANKCTFRDVEITNGTRESEFILSGRISNVLKTFNVPPQIFNCSMRAIVERDRCAAILDKNMTIESQSTQSEEELIEFIDLRFDCKYDGLNHGIIQIEAAIAVTGPIPSPLKNVHKMLFAKITKNFHSLIKHTYV